MSDGNERKMKLEEFVIDQDHKEGVILGKGSFATVYRAFHHKTLKKYAIKVINIDLEKNETKEIENIRREIKVHQSLKNHPYIIKLYSHEYVR
jgi:serine/threonine protein kinase